MNDFSNIRLAFGTGRDSLTAGPSRDLVGYPNPAQPCRCSVPWVEDEGCVRCGYWLHATIRKTWADQAQRLAASTRQEQRRSVRAKDDLARLREEYRAGLAERRSRRHLELVSPGVAGVAL